MGARPPLVYSGWKCRHDALVMWLLLRQDATDEGACWCGGGSLDLKCYCFNALTDEGMRTVNSCAHLPRALEVLQGDGRGEIVPTRGRANLLPTCVWCWRRRSAHTRLAVPPGSEHADEKEDREERTADNSDMGLRAANALSGVVRAAAGELVRSAATPSGVRLTGEPKSSPRAPPAGAERAETPLSELPRRCLNAGCVENITWGLRTSSSCFLLLFLLQHLLQHRCVS